MVCCSLSATLFVTLLGCIHSTMQSRLCFPLLKNEAVSMTKWSTTVGTRHDGGGPIVGFPWMLRRGLGPIVVQSDLDY